MAPTLPPPNKPLRAPRAQIQISAKVTAGKRKDVTFTIENLSVSGAKMEGPLAIALKQTIGIVFEAEGKFVSVQAEVVRVDTADLMTDQIAVQFIDPSPETKEAIRALVEKHLRNVWGDDLDDDDGDDTVEDSGDDTEIVVEPE
jgi:hypothetical protein